MTKAKFDNAPDDCVAMVEQLLKEMGLPYTDVTARKAKSLAGIVILVKVHGWEPNPKWKDLQELASRQGFRVEA